MPRPNNRLYELLDGSPKSSPRGIKVLYDRVSKRLRGRAEKGDEAAADRLVEVEFAYSVLSDPSLRAKYDRGGEAALEAGDEDADAERDDPYAREWPKPGPDGPQRYEHEPEVVGDGDGDFIGDAGSTGQVREVGGVLELRVDFVLACTGGRADIVFKGEHRTVPVPIGTVEGEEQEVAGVQVRYRVVPDRYLKREGDDLLVDISIEYEHARDGVQATVPTLDGKAKVKIPKGVRTGQRLRLKGKGIPFPEDPSDLYVSITVLPPGTGRVRGVGFMTS
jgi:curved DNA-binding protein